MTTTLVTETAAKLKTYIDTNDLSQTYVAKGIGKSPATISTYLAGTYKGDVKNLDSDVESWLVSQSNKKDMGGKITISFIPDLVNAKAVWEIAKLCQIDGELGVVVGDSGTGKTASIKAYAVKNPNTIILEVNQTLNKRALIVKLAEFTGARISGSLNDMFEAVCDKLKSSGRLVVVDEAEYLTVSQLEILRRLHDHSEDDDGNKIGLLLMGLPRLRSNIKGKRGEFAQIYSRVGVFREIKPLNKESVEVLLNKVMGSSKHVNCFLTRTNGNIRLIVKLLGRIDRIMQINNIQEVDIQIINGAMETLIF